jgi:hypothetical protein
MLTAISALPSMREFTASVGLNNSFSSHDGQMPAGARHHIPAIPTARPDRRFFQPKRYPSVGHGWHYIDHPNQGQLSRRGSEYEPYSFAPTPATSTSSQSTRSFAESEGDDTDSEGTVDVSSKRQRQDRRNRPRAAAKLNVAKNQSEQKRRKKQSEYIKDIETLNILNGAPYTDIAKLSKQNGRFGLKYPKQATFEQAVAILEKRLDELEEAKKVLEQNLGLEAENGMLKAQFQRLQDDYAVLLKVAVLFLLLQEMTTALRMHFGQHREVQEMIFRQQQLKDEFIALLEHSDMRNDVQELRTRLEQLHHTGKVLRARLMHNGES